MHIMNTMNLIALCADSMLATSIKRIKNLRAASLTFARHALLLRLGFVAASSALLLGCATPQPPAPKAVYDFGAVLSAPASQQSAPAALRTAAIALPEIEASGSLDSPALLYRLQYSNAQQLLPYATARWSVSPAQLVRARVRDALAAQGPVLTVEGSAPWVLRIELDEFSQIFESPSSSSGLIRLRASLLKNDQLVAQTSVIAREAALTQDAAGGVRALTGATDDAVRQLSQWLAVQIK